MHHLLMFSVFSNLTLEVSFDWFNGISTLVGYLMPNPLYIYIYIEYI